MGLSAIWKTRKNHYLAQVFSQSDKHHNLIEGPIRSRDILSLQKDRLKKIWDEKYPVEVKDKIIIDNLGYCGGAIIENNGRMFFRSYGENQDILDALDKDLTSENSEEVFNKDSKIILMSTSYGHWRWYFEKVKKKLIVMGLSPENIVVLGSDTSPSLDGISVCVFPDKTAQLHYKNHSQGVFQ